MAATQRTVAVNFTANVAGYNAGVASAAAATSALQASAGKTSAAMAGRGGLAASARQATQAFLPLPPALIGAGGVAYALKESVSAAISFESAMAGVRKTVDISDEGFANLTREIRLMSLEVPTAAEEIAGVAEAAGQLGIETDSIMGFTRVMVDLGETTNLASRDAATQLARLANITQMSQSDFDRLGATVVSLGNNLATTEAEIVDMALGIAGAGQIVGLTEPQIMALAGALSEVGIEAEAGGSSISRTFLDMMEAVQGGTEKLDVFARTAGMSVDEFSAAFRDDAASALVAFIEGLQRVQESGGNVLAILDEVGLSDIRVRRALLNMTGAGDGLAEALEIANTAWEENIALTEEASKRYETAESGLKLLGNVFKDMARDVGEELTPAIDGFGRKVADLYAAQQRRKAETGKDDLLFGLIPHPANVKAELDDIMYYMDEWSTGTSVRMREEQAALAAATGNNIEQYRLLANTLPDVTGAMDTQADTTGDLESALEDYAFSLGFVNSTLEEQLELLRGQEDLARRTVDPIYNLMRAQEELAAAQSTVNDLIAAGDTKSSEAAAAVAELMQANIDYDFALQEAKLTSDGFITQLQVMLDNGTITREMFEVLADRVADFGVNLDLIDGRVTRSTHIHTTIEETRTIFGSAPSLTGRAVGGPVKANEWYLVGEEGPELLVPDVPGTIIPADQTADWMRGSGVPTQLPMASAPASSVVNYNIEVRMPPGADGNEVVAALRRWERSNGPVPLSIR